MKVSDILDFLEVVTGDAFDVPPEVAIDYFRRKGLRPTFSYADALGEAHDHAFTVAKMADVDLLGQVRASLDKALAEGMTFADWKRDLVPMLQRAGWWGTAHVVDPVTGATVTARLGTPWRLETIFRTNLQTSYAAGQWKEIVEQSDVAPYLMYDAVDDHRTRPLHAKWDGTLLPVDHPWWEAHYPPNGYNCRCGVIQLSRDEAEGLGLSVGQKAPDDGAFEWTNPRTGQTHLVPAGIDPGFDRNPGLAVTRYMRQMLDEKISALPPDMQSAAVAGMRRPFDTSTPAGKWHAQSFDSSPDWVRDVVLRQQAVDVMHTRGEWPYAMHGRMIEMDERRRSDAADQATWRHEFGHILDVRLATSHLYRSSQADFVAARRADADELIAAAGRGRRSKKQAARIEALRRGYEDVRERIIDAGPADRLALLRGMADEAGIDLDRLLDVLRESTLVLESAELTSVGVAVRAGQMIRALAERDAEQFLRLAALMDAGGSLTAASWRKDVLASLSDLIGATTNNRLASWRDGFPGHSDSYYRQRSSLYDGNGTEAFANLLALAGHRNVYWWEIVRRLTPRMADLFEQIILGGA